MAVKHSDCVCLWISFPVPMWIYMTALSVEENNINYFPKLTISNTKKSKSEDVLTNS